MVSKTLIFLTNLAIDCNHLVILFRKAHGIPTDAVMA